MKIRFALVVVAAVFGTSAFYTAAGAQAPSSVLEGVYTEEQATRGQKIYADQCAACHGEMMAGMDPIPALAGADFVARWKNVGELFEKTATTMPAIDPGSLSGPQVAEVIAHVLAVNKYPAGKTELAPKAEALTPIKIEPAK
ncbi:MAG TPA: cytochrome c [Vicinamibacterales bacterium]